MHFSKGLREKVSSLFVYFFLELLLLLQFGPPHLCLSFFLA